MTDRWCVTGSVPCLISAADARTCHRLPTRVQINHHIAPMPTHLLFPPLYQLAYRPESSATPNQEGCDCVETTVKSSSRRVGEASHDLPVKRPCARPPLSSRQPSTRRCYPTTGTPASYVNIQLPPVPSCVMRSEWCWNKELLTGAVVPVPVVVRVGSGSTLSVLYILHL